MMVILDMDGWRKAIPLGPVDLQRGYVEVCIKEPTANLIARKFSCPKNQTYDTFRFFDTGEVTENRLKIFKLQAN